MQIREATNEDLKEAAESSVSRGLKENPASIDHVYCLEHGGKVLAVGGLKMMNCTTAWCWMNWTQAALENQIATFRIVREWLDKLVELYGLRRLMAAVEVDFPNAVRTIEHLGFTRECVMPCWDGDKSAYLYARVVECRFEERTHG